MRKGMRKGAEEQKTDEIGSQVKEEQESHELGSEP